MSEYRPVLAHHLILTCHGFWLPNDPRGSGSLDVWADALKPFGPATYVNSRRSVASHSHDVQRRRAAKAALKRPPVRLTGRQAAAAARGVGIYLRYHHLTCLAFSIMPDHLHLVLQQNPLSIHRISVGIKAEITVSLVHAGLHPYQNHDPEKRPKVWARGERKVFLFDQKSIDRSIRYVNDNPIKTGLKPQRWSFVTSI